AVATRAPRARRGEVALRPRAANGASEGSIALRSLPGGGRAALRRRAPTARCSRLSRARRRAAAWCLAERRAPAATFRICGVRSKAPAVPVARESYGSSHIL